MRQDPIGARLQALGMGMTPVEKKIRGVTLTPQQYEDYARVAGMMTHQRLSAMVSNLGFASMPAGFQMRAIQETISHTREAAASLIQMRNPGVIAQGVQIKLAIRTIGR